MNKFCFGLSLCLVLAGLKAAPAQAESPVINSLRETSLQLAASLADAIQAHKGCDYGVTKAEIVQVLSRALKARDGAYPGAPLSSEQTAYLRRITQNSSIQTTMSDFLGYKLLINQFDLQSMQLDLNRLQTLFAGTKFYSDGTTSFTEVDFLDDKMALVEFYDEAAEQIVHLRAQWSLSLQPMPGEPISQPVVTIDAGRVKEQLNVRLWAAPGRSDVVLHKPAPAGSHSREDSGMSGEVVACAF